MKRAGIILLVLLAGCSGALTSGTPSPEVTPAPVPSETPTSSPVSPIPGVTNGILANPGQLVTAHSVALSEVGYTRVRVERARVGDRIRWNLTTRTRVAPDGRRHAVIVHEGPEQPPTLLPNTTRVERYVGESGTWVAVWRNGDRQITRYPQEFAVGQPPLYPVLGSVPIRIENQNTTDEGLRFRLVGSGVRDEELLMTATRSGNPVGSRLVVTVTPRGVVRSYTFSYALGAGSVTDTRRSFTHRFHIRAVGETAVSIPGWVPAERASS